jgi:hypothetical protein
MSIGEVGVKGGLLSLIIVYVCAFEKTVDPP